MTFTSAWAWGSPETYSDQEFRFLVELLTHSQPTSVIGANSLAVAQQTSPANTIKIASGRAIIKATSSGTLGTFAFANDADVTPAGTIAPTGAGVSKYVEVIVRIVAGVPTPQYVEGVAAGSPTPPTITGDDYIHLAQILMPANTTNITDAMITDQRTQMGQPVRNVGTVTGLAPFEGLTAYERNNNALRAYDGTAWHTILDNSLARARVFNNTFTTITSAVVTPLTFNSERYDVGGCHSTVSNTGRLTVPTGKGGVYHIGGCVQFASNGTGERILDIRLNGTTFIARQRDTVNTATTHTLNVSTDYLLAAGDFVELVVFQNTGGALNVDSQVSLSPEFWFHQVSAV